MSAEIRSLSHVRASVPDTETTRHEERSTNAAPEAMVSATSCCITKPGYRRLSGRVVAAGPTPW